VKKTSQVSLKIWMRNKHNLLLHRPNGVHRAHPTFDTFPLGRFDLEGQFGAGRFVARSAAG
jgi:hypothetical protein